MLEHQALDRKSLRKVTGGTADWDDLARTCVCFANTRGGVLLIGIEDGQVGPPAGQRIPPELPLQVMKRISEKTINVNLVFPRIEHTEHGDEYLSLEVPPSNSIACTTDGRYFMRVSDSCKPVLPESLTRLVAEKGAFTWEIQQTEVASSNHDLAKLSAFLKAIRASERVKDSVRIKSDTELLAHYGLTCEDRLTRLGILWIGLQAERARLAYTPAVQFIRYDERGQKIEKRVWDDDSLNPTELLEAVMTLPVWRESIEVPSGMFREQIPIYDQEVVRELMVNALVHRMYTMQGDIFLNLYPDRLEVHSPGPLPAGVTPHNILHQSVRRNDHLARLFHDLKLMEREGSGYDRLYEVLLRSGKSIPQVEDGHDRVKVTIRGHDLDLEARRVLDRANTDFPLTQRELVTLGLIAQHRTISTVALNALLALRGPHELRSWMGRLRKYQIVLSHGKTRGTTYRIHPQMLQETGYKGKTSLLEIEDHRLRELILTDLRRYPGSALGTIQARIGIEISRSRIQRQLRVLLQEGLIYMRGVRRWARYEPVK